MPFVDQVGFAWLFANRIMRNNGFRAVNLNEVTIFGQSEFLIILFQLKLFGQ